FLEDWNMAENLLTPTGIKLFGRVMEDLTYNSTSYNEQLGNNEFLKRQLDFKFQKATATFTGSPTTGDIITVFFPDTAGLGAVSYTVQSTDNTLAKLAASVATSLNNADAYVQASASATIITMSYPRDGLPTYTSLKPDGTAGSEIITFASVSTFPAANFARIYGFSFEGQFYDLPKPAIFLVHGPGETVDANSTRRTNLDDSGVVAREWEFSSARGQDIRRWDYDKGDFSIRLDIETGPFEAILLEA